MRIYCRNELLTLKKARERILSSTGQIFWEFYFKSSALGQLPDLPFHIPFHHANFT